MSEPETSDPLLAELARVAALFQARALAAHIGAPMPKPEDFKK